MVEVSRYRVVKHLIGAGYDRWTPIVIEPV
jgi:hypothetical protein